MSVQVGSKIPHFSLPDQNGNTVSVEDFLGKTLILYFYPKDNTPGCTTEACDFKDLSPSFARQNSIIVGVSPDSPKSHQSFMQKYSLNFPLLCDTDKRVASLFGVYKEKNIYGRKVMGIERSTFIINAEGVLVQEYRKVKVKGHVENLLAALETQVAA